MAISITNPVDLLQFANPQPQQGVSFSADLARVQWTRTGGSFGYSFNVTWSITGGSLPSGMSIGSDYSSSSYFYVGLSGTPTVSGAFSITLQCSVQWTETSVGFSGSGTEVSSSTINFNVAAGAGVTEVDAITTNFNVNGSDLNTIFAGLSGLTAAANTGLTVNGTDLAQLFAPLSNGSAAPATGYLKNGADLNTIFAARGTL